MKSLSLVFATSLIASEWEVLGYRSHPPVGTNPYYFRPLVLDVAQVVVDSPEKTATANSAAIIAADDYSASEHRAAQIRTTPAVVTAKYDLGIRQVQPVFSRQGRQALSSEAVVVDDVPSLTQYIVEYAATREFPSLLGSDTNINLNKPSSLNHEASAARSLPKVRPVRRAEDVLTIEDVHVASKAESRSKRTLPNNWYHPYRHSDQEIEPTIRATTTDQLELNTIWVEMLLHSEQMEMRTTLAPSPQ